MVTSKHSNSDAVHTAKFNFGITHSGSAEALVASGVLNPECVPGWPVGRGATKASWWHDDFGHFHMVKTLRGGALHYAITYGAGLRNDEETRSFSGRATMPVCVRPRQWMGTSERRMVRGH